MIAATLRMQIGPASPVRYTCAARVCIAHAKMMKKANTPWNFFPLQFEKHGDRQFEKHGY